CGPSLRRCGPKLLMNVSAGSRTTSSYRCLFLANQSRSLWRLSWRRNWKRSGRKNASLGTSGTSNLSLGGSATHQSWSSVERNDRVRQEANIAVAVVAVEARRPGRAVELVLADPLQTVGVRPRDGAVDRLIQHLR